MPTGPRAGASSPALRRAPLAEVATCSRRRSSTRSPGGPRVTISATGPSDHHPAAGRHRAVSARGAAARTRRSCPCAPASSTRCATGARNCSFGVAEVALPAGLRSRVLLRGSLRHAACARDHPAAAHDWTAADYAALDHVLVTVLGEGRGFSTSSWRSRASCAGSRCGCRISTLRWSRRPLRPGGPRCRSTLAARFAPGLDLVVREPPVSPTGLHADPPFF